MAPDLEQAQRAHEEIVHQPTAGIRVCAIGIGLQRSGPLQARLPVAVRCFERAHSEALNASQRINIGRHDVRVLLILVAGIKTWQGTTRGFRLLLGWPLWLLLSRSRDYGHHQPQTAESR